MLEQSAPAVHTKGRLYPWFCPKCRCKEVRGVTVPYQCERFYHGQSMTVVLAALEVPQCGKCGEMVFTYETEAQINRAHQAQIGALRNGASPGAT